MNLIKLSKKKETKSIKSDDMHLELKRQKFE